MIRSRVNPLINQGMLYIPHSAAYTGGVRDQSALEDLIQLNGTYGSPNIALKTEILEWMAANAAAGYSHTTIKGYNTGAFYLVKNVAGPGETPTDLDTLLAAEEVVTEPPSDPKEYGVMAAPTLFVFYGISTVNGGTSYAMGGISTLELLESKGTFLNVRGPTVAIYYEKHDVSGALKDENLALRLAGANTALSLPFSENLEFADDTIAADLMDLATIPAMEEGMDRTPFALVAITKMEPAPEDMRENIVAVYDGKNQLVTPNDSGDFALLNYRPHDYSVTVMPFQLTGRPGTSLTIKTHFQCVTENVGIFVLYSSSVTPEVLLQSQGIGPEPT